MKIILIDWHRSMRLPELIKKMARFKRRCSCSNTLSRYGKLRSLKIILVDWHRSMCLPMPIRQMARSRRRCSCSNTLLRQRKLRSVKIIPVDWYRSMRLPLPMKENGQIEHVVKIEETTLSEDNPDRLASQLALFRAYQANKQIE